MATTDNGTLVSDTIGAGKRLVGNCSYCKREAPQYDLKTNLGACNRPRCVLASMRNNM